MNTIADIFKQKLYFYFVLCSFFVICYISIYFSDSYQLIPLTLICYLFLFSLAQISSIFTYYYLYIFCSLLIEIKNNPYSSKISIIYIHLMGCYICYFLVKLLKI